MSKSKFCDSTTRLMRAIKDNGGKFPDFDEKAREQLVREERIEDFVDFVIDHGIFNNNDEDFIVFVDRERLKNHMVKHGFTDENIKYAFAYLAHQERIKRACARLFAKEMQSLEME